MIFKHYLVTSDKNRRLELVDKEYEPALAIMQTRIAEGVHKLRGENLDLGVIDTDELDMSSVRKCILGQLYKSFDRAPVHLKARAIELGLAHDPTETGGTEEGIAFFYARLTKLWKETLRDT